MIIRSAFAPPKRGLKHEFRGRRSRSTGFVPSDPNRNATMMVVAADNAVNVNPRSGRAAARLEN
jgi:hypothetical protein